MLAPVNCVYFSRLVAEGILMENGSYSRVPADASWLTCATTASDMEYWKVLLCFSLVGHELKVGRKTFAHGCGPKNMCC